MTYPLLEFRSVCKIHLPSYNDHEPSRDDEDEESHYDVEGDAFVFFCVNVRYSLGYFVGFVCFWGQGYGQ